MWIFVVIFTENFDFGHFQTDTENLLRKLFSTRETGALVKF